MRDIKAETKNACLRRRRGADWKQYVIRRSLSRASAKGAHCYYNFPLTALMSLTSFKLGTQLWEKTGRNNEVKVKKEYKSPPNKLDYWISENLL